jgi:hypothetical protein
MSPELMNDEGQLTDAFEAVDTYRRRFDAAPDTLTNAVLAGTLLVPLGLLRRRTMRDADDGREAPTQLGIMQVARRDIDRLRQILGLQRRLLDIDAPPRAQRALLARPAFRETLTWLDIHGRCPDVIAHWHAVIAEHQPVLQAAEAAQAAEAESTRRRRRPRRRRSFART